MGSQYAVDDSDWKEVKIINGYAVFMGYLMMGVRGLGVLVVTWTTVVLLGGFVSDLRKEDFWCLTGITLVQTAGVFDFLLKEKLSDMVRSWWGLLATVFATFKEKEGEVVKVKQMRKITYILAVIQGLVLCIMLCPLGVLYMLGLYMSAGVSLWRLIEHDFGNEGVANMKPALQVLYSLAVAQGVLFGYKTIHGLGARNRLAKLTAAEPGITVDEEVAAEYLEETLAGCAKDPSFATGRNLVTYGVGLMMESKSNEGFIAGIRVLGGAIKDDDDYRHWPTRDRKVLAKHLLTRLDSLNHMIQRLLDTVGPRSPYSREVRENAARIVALVARAIRLEQLPGVIECVSSMLDTSEEVSNQQQDSHFDWLLNNYGDEKLKNYERVEMLEEYELEYLIYDQKSPSFPDFSLRNNPIIQRLFPWKREKKETHTRRGNTLVVHGFDGVLVECMNIIHKLAVDDDRRRIMSNTLLPHKIAMAPLKLHRDNHDACRSTPPKSAMLMLEQCWVLTEYLVPIVKENKGSGGQEEIQEEVEELCHLRSTVRSAIGNAIQGIFDCLDCAATQKRQGILILLHFSLDMSFILGSESRTRRLTWILLLIFMSLHDDDKEWMIFRYTDRANNMLPDKFCSWSRLASEKLSDMLGEKHELPSGESARGLQLVRLALGDLTSAFADDAEDISVRTHAAIIMEYLCVHYDPYADFTEEAERLLIGVIQKVVQEILVGCVSTREERQAHLPVAEQGGVSVYDDLENGMCQDGYTDSKRLRKALVSLCRGGYMIQDSLRPKFEDIASKICEQQGKSFEYFKSLLA
ncbi:unnamed protein product [Urochloa humidicola]